MKLFMLSMTFLLFSPFIYGGNEKNKPSEFQVIPINSPVKEKTAKFSLTTPPHFEIQSVKFRVQKASDVLIKEKNYSPTKLISGSNGQELHIPMEGATPGFYRLFIRVKSKKDKDEEREFKSVYKDFINFSVAEKSPGIPMPDPIQNKATIGGVDSDRDGIRDDVQIWINEEYASNPNLKNGMRQLASTFQATLLTIHDENLSILASHNYLKSTSCMSYLVGIREKIKMTNLIKEKTLNTKDRHHAFIKANSIFSGQGIPVSIDFDYMKNQCDF